MRRPLPAVDAFQVSWSTHSPASAISSMSRTVSLTTAGSTVNVIDSPETVGGLAQVIAFVGIGVHGDGWSLSKETESIHLPVPREKPMQATGISRGVISAVRERAYGRDQKPQLRGAYCCSGIGTKKKQPGDCSTFRREGLPDFYCRSHSRAARPARNMCPVDADRAPATDWSFEFWARHKTALKVSFKNGRSRGSNDG
jgi:hypothetical protein